MSGVEPDEARRIVDGYIQDMIEGLVANARALEDRPSDRQAGARVQSHLITLERPYAVRRGLRDG